MIATTAPENTEYVVHVIAHTHWDREWYQPFQHFRIRLVHLMDKLLDLLEREPAFTHFNLDGQTIVLRDYLEIRPEKRQLLQELVSAGRLAVGPWYVLPDEFLVSGESMVRNLLLGHRIAREFGHVQKVGYIPDTFGHISQLPQLFQGFGIGTAMHFRGLDEDDLKSELWWEAPDGSRVLLRHLPTYAGYVNAAPLPEDADAAVGDLLSLAREEARRATTSVLLAMNGVDHMEAREDLPRLVALANGRGEGVEFLISSLEGYFAALQAAIAAESLQIVYGELRDTNRTPGRNMRVLPHILSSRIYNKMQNEHAQTMLERWAEPWSALMWTQGHEYPASLIWRSWEWLLENHPHDSIGGCSADAVHSQMETRFAWSTEIAEMVTAERLYLLARELDLSGLAEDEVAVVLFNGLPWAWDGVVTVDVDFPEIFLDRLALSLMPERPEQLTPDMDYPEIFRWRSWEAWAGDPPIMPDRDFRGLRLRPLDGTSELPVQIGSRSRLVVVTPLVAGPAAGRSIVRMQATFHASIPAYGYRVYAVRPTRRPHPHPVPAHPHNVLENEYLRVEIAANGALDVTDKTTGEAYRGVGYFEDGGDCGDGYNYSYPAEDRVYNTLGLSPRIMRLTDGPGIQRYRLEYDWALPQGLDATRRRRLETPVGCPLSVVVSLAEGGRRVDLEVTFDNRARNHRLRMCFPSDIDSDVSYSEGQFDVVERPVRPEPVPPEAWVEDPPYTHPQQSWMDLSDGKRGLCIVNRGLPEFEVLDTSRREIAITLLRAVAWLGAGPEILTADAGAGPHMPTPEAQIQRKLTFHLAIVPHAGTWDEAEVWRQAHMHNTPPRSVTVERSLSDGGRRPASASFLQLAGDNVVLDAVKQSEQGDGLIVRMHNPTSGRASAHLTPPFAPAAVHVVGLDEELRRDASQRVELGDDGRIHLALGPKEIVSLKLVGLPADREE